MDSSNRILSSEKSPQVSLFPRSLVVDGLWGSGKSLVGPAVGRLPGVDPFRISGTIEQVAALRLLNRLDEADAKFLIKSVFSMNFAANITSRSVNLRSSDDSFYFSAGGTIRELVHNYRNLGNLEDFRREASTRRWVTEMTHLMSVGAVSTLKLLPPNGRLITVRRHPFGLVETFYRYLSTVFGSDKDATVSVSSGSSPLPFFAMRWASEWDSLNEWEKAVIAVSEAVELQDQSLLRVSAAKSDLIYVIEFANLINYPAERIQSLARWLGIPNWRKAARYAQRQSGVHSANWANRTDLNPGQSQALIQAVKGRVDSKIHDIFMNVSADYSARSVSGHSLES